MTALERGIYRELLDEQFLSGPLPACERKLRMIARCDQDEWEQAREAVLAKFEQIDGRLVNARMESERNEREEIRQKRVEASQKRWKKKTGADAHGYAHGYAHAYAKDDAKDPVLHDATTTTTTTTNTKVLVKETALPFGPGFASAWDDWIAYRREARFPKWKQRTIDAQLERLGKLTEPQAVEAIRQSIANGWRGLFPEKAKAHNSRPTRNGAANAKIAAQVAAQPPGANNRIGDEQF
jgi:uncharacterized protein YdaU (DUF1376 family)